MVELNPRDEIDMLLSQGVTLAELKVLLRLKKRRLSREAYLEWKKELALRGGKAGKR